MVTVVQNVLVVTATVIVSLLFMAGLNQVWPRERRRNYNDLIGWQLSILGTTYAVILGFMLYTVWTSFGEADLNVDLEANAVVNLSPGRWTSGTAAHPAPEAGLVVCGCGHQSGLAANGQK